MSLHTTGVHSILSMPSAVQVPILDPQIHIQHGYAPYDQGIAQDIFIKDMTGQPYNGQARLHGPCISLETPHMSGTI